MFYFARADIFFFYMVVTSYVLSLGQKQLSWHFGVHLSNSLSYFSIVLKSVMKDNFVLFCFQWGFLKLL